MTAVDLPRLDCHAHLAPDVTKSQINALGNSHVFAVTRSVPEAKLVRQRRDEQLTWGVGVHPALPDAIAGFDAELFRSLLPSFALVGEIGLDRRGNVSEQLRVFRHVLSAGADQPVVLSIHSAGKVQLLLEELDASPVTHPILHWFLGDASQLAHAVRLGAYFSVNAAMPNELLRSIPRDRTLTETDFPARKTRASIPGDVLAVEQVLSKIWERDLEATRHQVWLNMKQLLLKTGAIDRVGEKLADWVLGL